MGWQAYLPAFGVLLQRFAGTEAWLDGEADSLPACLLAWLAAMADDNQPKSRVVPLLALRSWPLLHFRAASDDKVWDYRQCSFQQFVGEAGEAGIKVWFSPSRQAYPTLSLSLDFLRQHAQR